MSGYHQCAASGCTATVPERMLMCLTHWRKVSRKMQDEVYAAYRERGNTPGSPLTMRYARAVKAAREAVK